MNHFTCMSISYPKYLDDFFPDPNEETIKRLIIQNVDPDIKDYLDGQRIAMSLELKRQVSVRDVLKLMCLRDARTIQNFDSRLKDFQELKKTCGGLLSEPLIHRNRENLIRLVNLHSHENLKLIAMSKSTHDFLLFCKFTFFHIQRVCSWEEGE